MFDQHDDGDPTGTVMGDLAQHGLLMFLMMFVLLLPFINDPGKKADSDNIDPPSQGVLRVEVFWPDEQNIDVDLWVSGPIGAPVGYSNKGSELWNLLRDDLGGYADASGKNMEVSYTRGIWDGEYIVNLHLFALKPGALDSEKFKYVAGRLPVPCKVILYYKPDRSEPEQQLVYSDVELKRGGQELTVFRFMVADFKPDLTTLNHLQKNIRSAKDSQTPRPYGNQ